MGNQIRLILAVVLGVRQGSRRFLNTMHSSVISNLSSVPVDSVALAVLFPLFSVEAASHEKER